eukprot:105837-Amphidinium_carterae.3
MGDALVKTGGQFLLYFPEDVPREEGPLKKRRTLRLLLSLTNTHNGLRRLALVLPGKELTHGKLPK